MKRSIAALCVTLLATGALAQDRADDIRDDRWQREFWHRDAWRDHSRRGDGWQRHAWRGNDWRGGMGRDGADRFSPEDIDAFVDARIAALRAGLKLTADQEKLWPAFEEAARTLVQQRREQRRAWLDGRERTDDLPGRLRRFAEQQTVRAEALRKLADAITPLYASFDEGQKRRFGALARRMRYAMMHGMEHGGHHRR
jgi:zinc resistance-associated protein